MNCLEVRIKILQFLFGELTIVELAELHEHLGGCAECKVELEAVEMLMSCMDCLCDCEPVPEHVRERIYIKLAEDTQAGPRDAGAR